MKKLKVLALIFASITVLSVLAGCGEKSEQQNDELSDIQGENIADVPTNSNPYSITTKEKFTSIIGELVDLSKYDDLYVNVNEDSSFSLYSYTIKSENKKEYDLDYRLELGDGTKFTMPITIKDMQKMGWEFSYQSDKQLSPGYETYVTLKNSAGKELLATIYNNTGYKTDNENCTVIGVEVAQYKTLDIDEKLESAIDFTICETITEKSTLKDIIKKIGEPTSISCTLKENKGEYGYSVIDIEFTQKSSPYSSIRFELSGDNDYIATIKYNVKPN